MKLERIQAQFHHYLMHVAQGLIDPKHADRLPTRERLLTENNGHNLRRRLHLSAQEAYRGYTNSPYFERLTKAVPSEQPLYLCYQLKANVSASRAISDLIGNPRTIMILSDQGKVNLMQYVALLSVFMEAIGESRATQYFDRLFSTGPARLTLTTFSALEGVQGNCTIGDTMHAPFSLISSLLKMTFHKQFHPDNEKDSYIFSEGDLVYFKNHPSYRARHPLGAMDVMVGICVKAGKVDENPQFALPSHYQGSLSLAEIKQMLVQATNQPTPAWMQQAWAKQYHPPAPYTQSTTSLTETDLEHYILPTSITVAPKAFRNMFCNDKLIDTLHIDAAHQMKFILLARQNMLIRTQQNVLILHSYIQENSDLSSPANLPGRMGAEYAHSVLKAAGPLLDAQGEFSMSIVDFTRSAPMRDLLESLVIINSTFGLRMMQINELEVAIQFFNNVISFSGMLNDYISEADTCPIISNHLTTAVAERNIARCFKKMDKPLCELLHCQSCYVIRLQWLGKNNPRTLEVENRIDALIPIRNSKENEFLEKAYALLGNDKESLIQGKISYSSLYNQSADNTSLGLKCLERASELCESAEAALILGHVNLENVFQLLRFADDISPEEYAEETHSLGCSTAGQHLLRQGLLNANSIDSLQNNPDCESHLLKCIQGCMRYYAYAFYYRNSLNGGMITIIDTHVKALIASVGLQRFETVIDEMNDHQQLAIHCFARCYLARQFLAKKGVEHKLKALSIISKLWNNIDYAVFQATFHPATFSHMQKK